MDEALRYPIGKFSLKEDYSKSEIHSFIGEIQSFPGQLEELVSKLSDGQLDTPYRDGGWTVRQVIHHLADSHMNAYVRVKWALTESSPLIKAYNEKLWAETPETTADVNVSIQVLKALHTKWVILLKSLSDDQLNLYFTHPETKRNTKLKTLIAMYAWHGNHHFAHIKNLLVRMSWN